MPLWRYHDQISKQFSVIAVDAPQQISRKEALVVYRVPVAIHDDNKNEKKDNNIDYCLYLGEDCTELLSVLSRGDIKQYCDYFMYDSVAITPRIVISEYLSLNVFRNIVDYLKSNPEHISLFLAVSDQRGKTLLHHACTTNNRALAEELIEIGIDIDSYFLLENSLRTPLWVRLKKEIMILQDFLLIEEHFST